MSVIEIILFLSIPTGIVILIGTLNMLVNKWFEKRKKKDFDMFHEWINQNYQAILDGYAIYYGEKITLETRLYQYQYVLSFVLLSFKRGSRYFLMSDPKRIPTKLIYTISTFLL